MEKAIGIFDSGIGGLTVAKAIKNAMPNEQIIYFGDTKHLPYGDKSIETLIDYSLRITEFLLSMNVKAIVIACNSASAAAYNHVKDYAKGIPVYNVIDPIVDYIAKDNSINKVGLIATKATVNSKVYSNKIAVNNTEIETASLATPLLVPMIEEGFYDNKISNTIISNYLNNETLNNIDTLILGCTHYPLIENEISNFYKGRVSILNSANIVADKVKRLLSDINLSSNTKNHLPNKFYVSDITKSFQETAKIIFEENIVLEKISL